MTRKFEGMTVEQAEAEAAKEGMFLRVVMRDEEEFVITAEIRTDRYNVIVIGEKIKGLAPIY